MISYDWRDYDKEIYVGYEIEDSNFNLKIIR